MNKHLIQSIFACITISVCGITNGYSQADTAKASAFEGLSLKDLLNIRIVSVSKESELLFDAPLSASVVNKEEIRRAGCTSIMEAMRLVPGMIVREQSNGNYDIHLRGMDNVPPNAPFDVTSNTTTLVMIDSRPVYSYLRGGTFWETLPIDINDVEKIEVIRGPAAALYGPNAVNGVINIITRQTKKDGLYLIANTQQGSNHTFINNASVGYQSNKWSMIASGNYQGRDRTQTSYFEFYRNKWLEQPDYFITFNGDTATNVKQRYPDPLMAMDKYAGNIFLNYNPAAHIKFSLATGAQHSMAQRVSTENEVTPLSTVSSDSRYVDLKAGLNRLTAGFSYNTGTQISDYDPGKKYDFSIVNGNLEYNYTKGRFSLKPGLSYTSAIYDDTKYLDVINKKGLFNDRAQITTQSASLRGEYKLFDNKLRLVAGVAANTFNYPDETYMSYEFAATYKINKKHLFRVVYSESPRSSNIFDTYGSKTVAYFPIGYKKFERLALEGNKDLKLLTANMFEIGYRGNMAPGLDIDVELFAIHAENYTIPVNSRPYTQLNGTDTIVVVPIRSMNLPLQLYQQGITVSLTWQSKKWRINPFITIQHTNSENYAPFNTTPDAGAPGAQQNNIYSGIGKEAALNSTPTTFGGATVNYALTSKFNVNLNAYYYTAQTYYHLSNILFNDGVRGIDHIPAKLIMNAKVSYEPVKGLHFFGSAKNLLNDASREFFRSDAVPFMLLAGINYEF